MPAPRPQRTGAPVTPVRAARRPRRRRSALPTARCGWRLLLAGAALLPQAAAQSDCGAYVCPTGWSIIPTPASTQCDTCSPGGAGTCANTGSVCTQSVTANRDLCCTALSCTGGADPASPNVDYSPCTGLVSGQDCTPTCASGHYGVNPTYSGGACDSSTTGTLCKLTLACTGSSFDGSAFTCTAAPCMDTAAAPAAIQTLDSTNAAITAPNGVDGIAGSCACITGFRAVTSTFTDTVPTYNLIGAGSPAAVSSGWSHKCKVNSCEGGAITNSLNDANMIVTSCAVNTKFTGQTCTFTCTGDPSSGYTPTGSPFTLFCDANNQFDITPYSCTPNTCAQPANLVYATEAAKATVVYALPALSTALNTAPAYGYSPCEGLVTGQVCEIDCGEGYVRSGGLTLTCLTTGAYEGGSVTCTALPCPGNATFVAATATALATCACNTAAGYTGTQVWDSSAFKWTHTCSPNACSAGPTNVIDGEDHTACTKMYTGQTCTTTCVVGYSWNPAATTAKSFTLVCSATFQWTHAVAAPVRCLAAACPTRSAQYNPNTNAAGTSVAWDHDSNAATPKIGTCGDDTTTLASSSRACCAKTTTGAADCKDSTFTTPAYQLQTGTTAETWDSTTNRWTHVCVATCETFTQLQTATATSCSATNQENAGGADIQCPTSSASSCNADLCCIGATCTKGSSSDRPTTNVDANADYSTCVGLMTGDICTPVCATGYTVQGQITLACNNAATATTGDYDAAGATCVANSCNGGPVAGTFDALADYTGCNIITTGQDCPATCPTGYTALTATTTSWLKSSACAGCKSTPTTTAGDGKLVCNADGTYDATPSTGSTFCTANQCTTASTGTADTNAEASGYQSCQSKTTGQICTPVCKQGYSLVPTAGFTLVCDATNNFDASGARCTAVDCPDNAYVDTSTGVRRCLCSTGYTGTIIWVSPTWSGTCAPNDCTSTMVANSKLYSFASSLTGRTGDVINIECNTGYTVQAPGTATCLSDGTWKLYACIGNACPSGQVANSVSHSTTGAISGLTTAQTLTVSCKPGYKCSMSPCVATCQATGILESPQCQAVPCPTNANTQGTCACNNGYIAVPAFTCTSTTTPCPTANLVVSSNWDDTTDPLNPKWKHICYASCGLHTCNNAQYQLTSNPVPDSVQCNGLLRTTCDDPTCCFGITVVPSGTTLVTTESGGIATFAVSLISQPAGQVTITFALGTGGAGEGAVSPASVIIPVASWNQVQTITVTGLPDNVDDGDQTYTIEMTVVEAPTGTPPVAGQYNGVSAPAVTVINTDDDAVGVMVTPLSLVTNEQFSSIETFTVVLGSEPTAQVVMQVSSGAPTEGLLSSQATPIASTSLSLTFLTSDWNVPQTVTVHGQDDDVDDGDRSYTVTLAPITSTDILYNGMNPPDVAVTNIDDDTRGITVKVLSNETTEAGGTASFTIQLQSQPTAIVTIPITVSDTSEAQASPTAVTFSSSATSWKTPVTVTITGLDDLIADGTVGYTVILGAASSLDIMYNGLDAPDVTMINIDNDRAGVIYNPSSGLQTTEAGQSAMFTIRLTSQPTADVTANLLSRDPTEGRVSPASLVFTSTSWATQQTATVTGVDDRIDDGDVTYNVSAAMLSADTVYQGISTGDNVVINLDDDIAGVNLSTTSLITVEGDLNSGAVGTSATFTVHLNTQPTDAVTLKFRSGDTTEGTARSASGTGQLSFSTLNWNVPQTVTITGVGDQEDDGNQTYSVITDALESATDTKYNGMLVPDVSVLNVDIDTAGMLITCNGDTTKCDGITTTELGPGTASFDLVLTSKPTSTVTIPVSSTDLAEGRVTTPASGVFTFDRTTWNVQQRVVVTGVDETIPDGNKPYNIRVGPVTSTDRTYSGMNAINVAATNLDDDTPGLTVLPNTTIATTEDPSAAGALITVVIGSKPTAAVTFELTISDLREAYFMSSGPNQNKKSLTFTASNWDVRQTVTIKGADDSYADGTMPYTIRIAPATSSDPNYLGFPVGGVTIAGTNADNDVAGLVVTPTSGLATSEEPPGTLPGFTNTFAVKLTAAPVGLTYIRLLSWATEGTLSTTAAGAQRVLSGRTFPCGIPPTTGCVDGAHLTLTFSNVTWSTAQTVTVSGVDDLVADGDISYNITVGPIVGSDAAFNGLTHSGVQVTNRDNDAAGVYVWPPDNSPGRTNTAAPLIVTEAGTQTTFWVNLTSMPTDNVIILITSTDISEGTISPNSITFTPATWNMSQTVTVTGVEDLVQDGNISWVATLEKVNSADPKYALIDPSDVSCRTVDDDRAGVTVTPLRLQVAETGSTARFSVSLASQPIADASIGLQVDQGQGGRAGVTVSPASLVFSPTTWDVIRTVTVTGVDDDIADGWKEYIVQVLPVVSPNDPAYNGINGDNVRVNVTDNDIADVVVNPTLGLSTNERGGTATFTVRLNSQPVAEVRVGVQSNDTSEGVVAPVQRISGVELVFNPSNWNVEQTVTVVGQDDNGLDDGPVAYMIKLEVQGSDPTYVMLSAPDVLIVNEDDDVPGVLVSPSSIFTGEDGSTGEFVVELTAQPQSQVRIPLTVGNAREGALLGSLRELVFDVGTWTTAQTVTVVGRDDDIADGPVVYRITVGPAASSSAQYNGLKILDVTVTNRDNDTAGIVVTEVGGQPLETTEAGDVRYFTVALRSKPLYAVAINLYSDDVTEGNVVPASLTFQNGNAWNRPQTVTVTGVDDDVDDGDVSYFVVTAAATSNDGKYDGLDPRNVACVNRDDDQRSIAVCSVCCPPGSTGSCVASSCQQDCPTDPNRLTLTTSENGLKAYFEVKLTSRPTANVALELTSSDTTEGTVTPSVLRFLASEWNVPKTVTVSGVDDDIYDPDQLYQIVTGSVVSIDAGYAGQSVVNVDVVNRDNDVAGITIRPTIGSCRTNSGAYCLFPFIYKGVAYSKCTTVDDPQGRLWCSTKVNASDWHVPGGNTKGYCVDSCNTWLTTTEAGVDVGTGGSSVGSGDVTTYAYAGTAEFTVALQSRPTADVTVGIVSDDTTEGVVTPNELTFLALNWAVAQTVTITAQDDSIMDGDRIYTVFTTPAVSGDPNYNGMNAADIGVNNTDDDFAGIVIGCVATATTTSSAVTGFTPAPTSFAAGGTIPANTNPSAAVQECSGPLVVGEDGRQAFFTISLACEPQAGVLVPITTSDPTEGTVFPTELSFSSGNWRVPQTVTVTGVADSLADGDTTFKAIIGTAHSMDATYRIDPPDVNIVNADTFDECIKLGTTCTNAGQICVDPGPSVTSVGDWECRCQGSSVGSARAARAQCIYQGECRTQGPVCVAVGQTCVDGGATNDWSCACVSPSTGDPQLRGPATCRLNECTRQAPACTAVGQTCRDPDLTVVGDWRCVCPPPRLGSARGAAATCGWKGECAAQADVCLTANQTCDDPTDTRTGDWECVCTTGVGRATARPATCLLDECRVYGRMCTEVNQVCKDPNTSPLSRADWVCTCQGSSAVGTAVAMPADCTVDECLGAGKVCRESGQTCMDPNPSPASTSDWVCNCVFPATGSAVARVAVCNWVGECVAKFETCTAAGQTCHDPNINVAGDWQCVCIPPYKRTAATAAPAICSYDECPSEMQKCLRSGQTCEDPNQDPASLNDWMCSCVAPAVGTATAGPAKCAFQGECVQNAIVCTSVGQSCNDPDTDVTGDWECVCVPPQQGRKQGGPAVCVNDECAANWQTCFAAGQLCEDRVRTPNSVNDWTCNCVPPATGSARGGPASCGFIGECVANAVTCTSAGQTCVDTPGDNNWQCLCVSPATGFAYGAAATCVVDECVENAAICASFDQRCVDPNHNVTSLNDWRCECTGGQSLGIALGKPAACVLNECNQYNDTCSTQGQLCNDPDQSPASQMDWECVCVGSATGRAVAQAAECAYEGECQQHFAVCTSVGQTCSDPDPNSPNSWQCVCVYPQTGQTQCSSPASCTPSPCQYDECAAFGKVCAQAGQTCRDPNTSPNSVGDWLCDCSAGSAAGSGIGTAVASVATCQWSGECAQRFLTCTSVGQTCLDPDPNKLGDWSCRCAWPQTGEATASRAECVLDECVQFASVCTNAGQVCFDPPPHSPLRTNDWTCRCTGGVSRGVALRTPASCVVDECLDNVNSRVCMARGQRCVDPNKNPWSRDDWTCQCVAPASGNAVRSPAVCAYTGECVQNAPTCEDSGQSCRDPSTERAGDWECVCVMPQTGRRGRGPARCTYDECLLQTTTCNSVGQVCVDPNQDPSSLNDWICRCVAPSVGQKLAAAATCVHFGECTEFASVCSARGQACNDPDDRVSGNWECVCVGQQQGRKRGGPAQCILDECLLYGTFCSEVGQRCIDSNTGPASLGDWQCRCPGLSCTGSQNAGPAVCDCVGECSANMYTCEAAGQYCQDADTQTPGDWECRCVYPMEGAARGKRAPCMLNECRLGGQVCANAGQLCVDSNTNALSLGDWSCECLGSASGRSLGRVADCAYSGECANFGTICAQAGQLCRDPDLTKDGDWECICVPPLTGGMKLAPAACQLDECLQFGYICTSVGQTCVDRNRNVTALNDWVCTCAPLRGQAVASAATCVFVGECVNNAGVCTAAGQSCADPDTEQAGDWECVCVAPSVGKATGAPATCTLDECVQNGAVCTSMGQRCVDPMPFQSSVGDWICECVGSAERGQGFQRSAVCGMDECLLEGVTGTCSRVGQLCVDPNTDPASIGDWLCRCQGQGSGEMIGGPAECLYAGECAANAARCVQAGQTCVDPDLTQSGDWRCECVPPFTGTTRVASLADCRRDECLVHGPVCTAVKQGCLDPNTATASTGDWRCDCPEPLGGSAVAGAAKCGFVGECEYSAVSCTLQGQSCVDPNLAITGDWACLCTPPQIASDPAMPNRTRGPAGCILDECTQYGSVCEARGQQCRDPDTSPLSIHDWVCECIPPATGAATGIAAVCTYIGECVQFGQVCAAAGQGCNDPDLTQTGNWECVCVPPAMGRGMGAPTSCVLDECLTNAGTCARAGQVCRDPDRSPSSRGDWTCSCVESGSGFAVARPANCAFIGECTRNALTCTAQGQACKDPTPDSTAASLNDWQCVCVPPLTGTQQSAPANCQLDECKTDGAVCTAVGQACADPDQSPGSVGDWTCTCAPPAIGTVVASVARCVLDECSGFDVTADCPQCKRNMETCTVGGQTCRDPDTARSGDWECVCPAPTQGVGRGKLGQCIIDECITMGSVCNSVGQLCEDRSTAPSSLGDWACACTGSASGRAIAGAAACTWTGECVQRGDVCASVGQSCRDPDGLASLGNWECGCIPPMTGTFVAGPASCILDECQDPLKRTVCDASGQRCVDTNTNPNSLGDWLCVCSLGTGSAQARVATCILDECLANGATCLSAGQFCRDPNKDPAKTGDWTCNCQGSASGSARAMLATCVFTGECAENARRCTAAKQTCVDPDPQASGDWYCECVVPSVAAETASGAVLGGPVQCVLNECLTQGRVCTNAGQRCEDSSTDPSALGDWSCSCAGSSEGSAVAALATCIYQGECVQRAAICTAVGQACLDPDRTVDGDWECGCITPASGTPTQGGVAVCQLDECEGNQLCARAQQSCVDPNKNQRSAGDWICSCAGNSNAEGTAVAAVATCMINECRQADINDICARAGQVCLDPITKPDSLGDWTCNCAGSATGAQVAAPAVCTYRTNDECKERASVCEASGQACRDLGPTTESLDDWQCLCLRPFEGTGRQQAAVCRLDECELQANSATCAAVGQLCSDPDTSASSRNDWLCQCPPPAFGVGRATVATCTYEGECATSYFVCEAAGQSCVDPNPNQNGDWQCVCVAPQSGSPMTRAPTLCILDECRPGGLAQRTCSGSGQQCMDPTRTPQSTNDWVCRCLGSGIGSAQQRAAACSYTGECAQRAGVCTSAGQACTDPTSSTGDWQCECAPPAVGKATGKAAACVLDECTTEGQLCAMAGQTCIDPNTEPNALGDWLCTCQSSQGVGRARAAVAICTQDECLANRDVCGAAGQLCTDPKPVSTSLRDWTCSCVGSSRGSRAAGQAACSYTGECATRWRTCSSRGQACVDPSNATGDWRCECIWPQTGSAGLQTTATCVLDECAYGSTAHLTCTRAGQRCFDPSPSPTSTGDWTCNCLSSTGTAVAAIASCSWPQGECQQNGGVCTSRGQTCVDLSTAVGDWECRCVAPQRGSARGTAASCLEDECIVNGQHCTSRGQLCKDDDTSREGTWQCVCPDGATGSAATARPTECAYTQGECAAFGRTCTNAGQACRDPTSAPNDWVCQCISPYGGTPATGRPALCTDPRTDCQLFAAQCTQFTQTCIDTAVPVSGDWRCKCTASTAFALGEAAVCSSGLPSTPVPGTPGTSPPAAVIGLVRIGLRVSGLRVGGRSALPLQSTAAACIQATAATLSRTGAPAEVDPATLTAVAINETHTRLEMAVTQALQTGQTQGQFAAAARKALDAQRASGRLSPSSGCNAEEIMVADCTRTPCAAGQVCTDPGGLVDAKYICTCGGDSLGKVSCTAPTSNQPGVSVCSAQCVVPSSSDPLVTANVALTVSGNPREDEAAFKEALGKALGVPAASITGLAYTTQSDGNTAVTATVQQRTSETTDSFVSTLQSRLREDSSAAESSVLSSAGYTVRGAPAVSTEEEDDNCFLGLDMGQGACAAIIAVPLAVVVGLVLFKLMAGKKAPPPPPPPPPPEKKFPPLDVTPAKPEKQLTPKNDDTEPLHPADPARLDDTEQPGTGSPHAAYQMMNADAAVSPQQQPCAGSGEAEYSHVQSPAAEVSQLEVRPTYPPTGYDSRRAPPRLGRGASMQGSPAMVRSVSSPYSRGRGSPAAFSMQASDAAPGTSGWV